MQKNKLPNGLLIAVIGFLLCCSVKGPSFPNAPVAEPAPIEGRYRFPLQLHLFQKNLRGELFLEKNKGKVKKTYFTMRSVGQNPKGAIRMRSYEGLAYRLGKGNIELRSERCYFFGKQDWEDRLIPLQRWDCDHLFFVYQSPSNFRKREVLKPLQTERTKHSDWFRPTPLSPIPLGENSLKRTVFFAGQIVALEESPKSRLVVVWGHSGGRLLRDGQILTAQDDSGKNVGKMKVLSRPGDFIVCHWIGPHRKEATVAYTHSAAYKSDSFF